MPRGVIKFLVGLFGVLILAHTMPHWGQVGGMLYWSWGSSVAVAWVFFLQGLAFGQERVGVIAWGKPVFIALSLIHGVWLLLAWGVSFFGFDIWFLALLPTTISSAVLYTELGGGNRGITVVTVILSIVVSLVVIPGVYGVGNWGVWLGLFYQKVGLQVIGPFLIGYGAARWITRLKRVSDLTSILVLYLVFLSLCSLSEEVTLGEWGQWVVVLLVIWIAMALISYGASCYVPERENQVGVWVLGNQKSLAMGLPVAYVVFPEAMVGQMLMPVVIYHVLQLVLGAWGVGWFSKRIAS